MGYVGFAEVVSLCEVVCPLGRLCYFVRLGALCAGCVTS